MDFVLQEDHWVKVKEIKKKMDKYQDFTRELKKLWTILPIIVGALGTVPGYLEKFLDEQKIKGKIKTA